MLAANPAKAVEFTELSTELGIGVLSCNPDATMDVLWTSHLTLLCLSFTVARIRIKPFCSAAFRLN